MRWPRKYWLPLFLFFLFLTVFAAARYAGLFAGPEALLSRENRIAVRCSVHALQAEPPPGVISLSQTAPINDALSLRKGLLAIGEGGLALADINRATVFHQGSGLPVSRLLRLLPTRQALFALAPEGLLRFALPVESVANQLEVTLIRPAGDARLVDGAVIDDRLLVLDANGRLLAFVEKKFQLLAQLPADPLARVGLLHGMPLVIADKCAFLVRDGDARRIHRLPAPFETATDILFAGDRALVASVNGLLALTEFGVETLLRDVALTAVARFDDRIVLGGVHGELLDVRGKRLASCPSSIRRLRVDDKRLLIAATAGVWSWDGAGEPSPALPNERLAPLPEGYVTALLPTADGRLLIGMLNRGLVVFDPDTGAVVAQRLADYGVNRIIRDGNAYLVAPTNGLVRLDDALAERRRYKTADGLPGRNVADVLVADRGVYLATNAGLARLTATGMQAIDAFHGLAGNHLYCLAADERGALAVGGLAGLSLLGGPDGLTVTKTYTAAAGLPHNWVNALAHSADGWLAGTYGGGVVVLNERGELLPCADTESWSINVNAVAAFGSLTVFGTLENALALGRDSRRWTSYSAGLPSSNVTALAVAGGALWVGTDHGVARVDTALLEAALK